MPGSLFSTLLRQLLGLLSKAFSPPASTATSSDKSDRQRIASECVPGRSETAPRLELPVPPEDCGRFLGAEDVQGWPPGRFRYERLLRPAPRNKGHVHWMYDAVGKSNVAVKVMPNDWVCASHADFLSRHPASRERPWVDIGCSAFLNDVSYPYACPLVGVYCDEKATRVVTELAPGGDLSRWSLLCAEAPGPAREATWLPVARQVLDALRCLHDLSIVHNDVSTENILVTRLYPSGALHIQLVDFGMATTQRFARHTGPSLAAYHAPELHAGSICDGFLSDAFAAGVVLYAVFMGEYPWVATQQGRCKAFEFACEHGLQGLIDRDLRQIGAPAHGVSEPLVRLLTGLLAMDPDERLTLGESTWLDGKRRDCIWEQPLPSMDRPLSSWSPGVKQLGA